MSAVAAAAAAEAAEHKWGYKSHMPPVQVQLASTWVNNRPAMTAATAAEEEVETFFLSSTCLLYMETMMLSFRIQPASIWVHDQPVVFVCM